MSKVYIYNLYAYINSYHMVTINRGQIVNVYLRI